MLNKLYFDYHNDPKELFAVIEPRDWSVLLDSHAKQFTDQRFDIMTSDPIKKIYGRGSKTILETKTAKEEHICDPIDLLSDQMTFDQSSESTIPFTGGAIGFASYDQGNIYENIKQNNDDFNIPYVAFGIYDWALIIDHKDKKTILIFQNKNEIVNNIIEYLSKQKNGNDRHTYTISSDCISNTSFSEYEKKFTKIKSYIENGDCYQINFAQRFMLNYEGSPWAIYKDLSQSYGAPYSAYLSFPFAKIMSFSPERFIHQKDCIVETKPIKGTRPVSSNESENNEFIEELRGSDKEKAENLMIVDLLRNDFGRTCEMGSVKVTSLFDIETFANVHHLVSTVQGKLKNKEKIFDLLKGCFPGGSITGAPKIRAMQIINELEVSNRGIYCGSIGYISTNSRCDVNIAIRTALSVDNTLYFWGGGGITFDSDVNSEYKETLDKIRPFLDCFRR
tara:strand:+ start:187 stop:1533 length:1347 start_codon:yes stop_codon:yes gene_type:complete